MVRIYRSARLDFFSCVKLTLVTSNKRANQSLLFRKWLQKLKPSSNYHNFRSAEQLRLLGNTPGIIQSKFIYLRKSLIYIKKFLYFPTNV